MPLNLLLAINQVKSKNDERQMSNNETMDQFSSSNERNL